jgi:hypothetical protein
MGVQKGSKRGQKGVILGPKRGSQIPLFGPFWPPSARNRPPKCHSARIGVFGGSQKGVFWGSKRGHFGVPFWAVPPRFEGANGSIVAQKGCFGGPKGVQKGVQKGSKRAILPKQTVSGHPLVTLGFGPIWGQKGVILGVQKGVQKGSKRGSKRGHFGTPFWGVPPRFEGANGSIVAQKGVQKGSKKGSKRGHFGPPF